MSTIIGDMVIVIDNYLGYYFVCDAEAAFVGFYGVKIVHWYGYFGYVFSGFAGLLPVDSYVLGYKSLIINNIHFCRWNVHACLTYRSL